MVERIDALQPAELDGRGRKREPEGLGEDDDQGRKQIPQRRAANQRPAGGEDAREVGGGEDAQTPDLSIAGIPRLMK